MASPAVPILIGGLFAWSVYRRVRRSIGEQPLRPRRIIVSIVVLSLASLLVLAICASHPLALAGTGGGLALGIGLGFVGLRLTRFRTGDHGHFYTPNTYIGGALSLLFAGRLLYRMWTLRGADPTQQPPLFQSPMTCFIFGLVAGYYIVFYIGLFVHTHDQKTPPAE